MNDTSVFVAGVGMIPFVKPGASGTYQEMGEAAIRLALADAGIEYSAIQQVYAGHVYGESTSGQSVAYRVGMTGIPVINVNNNCSTGSTALFLARQAVASGAVDCVLAVGFEQMERGALRAAPSEERVSPIKRFTDRTLEAFGHPDALETPRFFAAAGAEHMELYGTRLSTFAEVRAKASRHGVHNPLAVFRQELTVDDVMNSPELVPGLCTRLMACPPTCGAAAAIIVSAEFAKRYGLDMSVAIRAQAMSTDAPGVFEGSMRELVGTDMARRAAARVYEDAGIGPEDLDVVELHDCFAQNELITYESLGLTGPGGAERFILDGDNTYGGRIVTNPSGGLLSKGHPLGATGLAQCHELTLQLRGAAERRQVEEAKLALQHNFGLGGAVVVTLYERR